MKPSQIKKLLIEIVGEFNIKPFTASVVSIEGDTCTIKLVDNFKISGVKLRATSSEKTGVFVIPKINSEVLVISLTGGLENLNVIKVNEVDKVNVTVEQSEFEISPNGYSIKANNENLKTILNDLINEINKIFVVQGTTVNVAAVTLIQQRLNKVLT